MRFNDVGVLVEIAIFSHIGTLILIQSKRPSFCTRKIKKTSCLRAFSGFSHTIVFCSYPAKRSLLCDFCAHFRFQDDFLQK